MPELHLKRPQMRVVLTSEKSVSDHSGQIIQVALTGDGIGIIALSSTATVKPVMIPDMCILGSFLGLCLNTGEESKRPELLRRGAELARLKCM